MGRGPREPRRCFRAVRGRGLNAWLPLFGAALAQRLDLVELAQPFDDLSGTGPLVVLGVLTAADFVGDKIPAVDHVLHAIGTVVAPVSGAALFTGMPAWRRRPWPS